MEKIEGREKVMTLPAVITPEDEKEILSWKPTTRRYLELPLMIINSPELAKHQEGGNGSLIKEYYQKRISFLVSPWSPLTLLGKKMFYGIIPNLMKSYKGTKTAKVNTYEIIKKGKLKKGGSTYKEIDEELFKISHMFYYHFVTTGNREIENEIEGTPLFLYFRATKKKGKKETNWILAGNPVLNTILWDRLKVGYQLDNILLPTNKHELSLYLFLKTKLKPERNCFPIAEEKLIQHAGIHAKKKIHQRRDIKTALPGLEKHYKIISGKKDNIYFFYLLKEGPFTPEELRTMKKLLNQGKTPIGKNILKQWEEDQGEKERTRGEEAQNYTRKMRMQAILMKMGIKSEKIREITDTKEIDYLEKMLKKVESKNSQNPAGLFLHIIKNR